MARQTSSALEGAGPSAADSLAPVLGVLVVDDEHMVRVLLQLALERNGFQVWLASNGPEAIRLYREQKENIAVVLLDVCMPEVDGPKTLSALQQLNPRVPACFMTAEMGDYKEEELKKCGAAFVIAKPFHLDQLARILHLAARGVSTDPSPVE